MAKLYIYFSPLVLLGGVRTFVPSLHLCGGKKFGFFCAPLREKGVVALVFLCVTVVFLQAQNVCLPSI